MMKKTMITGFTALMLMGTMALPVSAQELQKTGDTEVTANVASDYVLTIPAKTEIAFNATSTDLAGTLTVTGNVLPTQEVEVTATPNALHNEAQNTDLPYTLKKDSETFIADTWNETELREETKDVQLSIAITEAEWNKAEAGNYTGSITFTANLKDVQGNE